MVYTQQRLMSHRRSKAYPGNL